MKLNLMRALRALCIVVPCALGGCWGAQSAPVFGTETHWLCTSGDYRSGTTESWAAGHHSIEKIDDGASALALVRALPTPVGQDAHRAHS